MNPSNPTPLQRINALAEGYAAKRARLGEITTEISDAQRAVLRQNTRRLRDAFNAAAAAQSALHAEISAHPELFEKPRSFVAYGLKLGFQKGKGKVIIADEEKTIALIRRHFEEGAVATLIKVEESVIRKAASNLLASDLKRIGIEIAAAGDEVIIAPVDSALDKLIDRLLAEATKEEA